MGTLNTGKRRGGDSWRGSVQVISWLCLDLHALAAKQMDAGTPVHPATPVVPEERSRANRHRMRTSRSPGAALSSHCHAIDTAHVMDRDGSCGCWPPRRCVG